MKEIRRNPEKSKEIKQWKLEIREINNIFTKKEK